MSLQQGDKLGPYEILEPLGSGGMGEVYRARDTRLDRDVAVKVLPSHIASSPDVLARFEREAKVVAGLSHPNITALHDFGHADDRAYAVMELLEGETLRARLKEGAIPARKAREIAVQVAQGLGAAHEKGVVHRDLKPENLFLTRDGRAKILDFGLASRMELPAGDDTATPTRTSLTEPGSVMGTVGYMSPEQVKGEAAEAASDVFSLGAVLFEMFTGQRAFLRETPAETMTAILREEPGPRADAAGSGPVLPPAVAPIVRRCLEKNPHERFHSAYDLAFALEALGEATTTDLTGLQPVMAPARARPTAAMVIAGAVFLAAAAFLAGRLLAPGGGPAGEATMRLQQLTFEGGVELQPRLAPDGSSFLFVANREGGLDIYLQRVGGETAINLTADYPERDYQPAFSPDGRQIAFRSERDGGGILVMGATGESARRLTDFGYNPAWTPDGTSVIVSTESIFNPAGRQSTASLWRIDATTGARTAIEGPYDAVQPRVSPSGERIAFWGLPEGTGTRVLYTMPAAGGEPVPLTDDPHMNWNPVWAPDGDSLYFASDRGGRMNIWRLPIDGTTGKARGEAIPVTQSTESVRQFDVGPEGQLLFASSSVSFALERLPWDVGAAKVTGPPVTVLETSRSLGSTSASPDGRWLAIWAQDRFEDLFVAAADGTKLRRLTNDTFRDRGPVWGPDSETIYIYSDRGGRYEIWRIRRDGSGLEQVTATEGNNVSQQQVSPDGTRMLLQGGQLFLADLTGSLPISEFRELPPPEGLDFFAVAWSPDGTRVVGFDRTSGEETTSTWILSVDDGSYRKVTDGVAVIAWPSEGRLLGLTDPDRDLVVVDPQTGESQPVAGFTGEIGQIVAAPDSLFNRRTRTQGDIWMLAPEPPTDS